MASAVVVDANIIFSSLLSEESRLRKVLLTGDDDFYVANTAIIELFKHKERSSGAVSSRTKR